MSAANGRMTCPVDGTTLVMSERSSIEIDYCPTCRGVWLDRGELDKIIERSAQPAPSRAPAQHTSLRTTLEIAEVIPRTVIQGASARRASLRNCSTEHPVANSQAPNFVTPVKVYFQLYAGMGTHCIPDRALGRRPFRIVRL